MKREVTEKQRTFVDKSPTIGRLTVAFGPFLKKSERNTRMREYKIKLGKEMQTMAGQTKVRIKLRAYDHNLIDLAAEKIVETVKRSGVQVSGPIPLPTEKEIITILRAVHKYKDSREQFELRTHKRIIDIYNPTKKTIDALMQVDVPAGVDIRIKL